ncbi:hypothetical protein LP421_22820 [Rhizobium sp. RCAM05350]|nr:hypothetical protein LP421_22820 [Rhizobium sp. RCAM05350]
MAPISARRRCRRAKIDAIKLHAYSDGFNLSTKTGPLKTTIETGATRFVSADIDRLVKGPVKIDGTLSVTPETVSFDPLTLESASVGGALTGSYTIAENTLATGFKLFALPAVLPPALAAKFDTTIAITGNLGTGANGGLTVSDLALKSGTIEATGSGNTRNRKPDGSGQRYRSRNRQTPHRCQGRRQLQGRCQRTARRSGRQGGGDGKRCNACRTHPQRSRRQRGCDRRSERPQRNGHRHGFAGRTDDQRQGQNCVRQGCNQRSLDRGSNWPEYADGRARPDTGSSAERSAHLQLPGSWIAGRDGRPDRIRRPCRAPPASHRTTASPRLPSRPTVRALRAAIW